MKKRRVVTDQRQLDAYNKFILLEQKFDKITSEFQAMSDVLPEKTLKVMLGRLESVINGVDNFIYPSDMPECDRRDIEARFAQYSSLRKQMQHLKVIAGDLLSA